METYKPLNIPIPFQFRIHFVIHKDEVLEIHISKPGIKKPTESIIIDASLCSRIADEGKRLKLLRDHSVFDAQIHECENSEFLQWFLKENIGIYDDCNLRHLLITDDNYVIDVLSAHLPKLISLEDSQ